MAEHTDPPQSVSPWVIGVATFAAAVVVVVAATVSYAHMYHLADRAGEGGLARLIPASVDGLVFFASTLIYAQHTSGEPKSKLAVFAVVLGVLMSIVANVVSKVPGLVSPTAVQVVVAAWPPAALGMVGHLAWKLLTLALRARRDVRAERPGTAVEIGQQVNIGTMTIGSQDARQEAPAALPEDRPEAIPAPSRELTPSPPKTARRTAPRRSRATVPDHEWIPYVRRLRDDLASQGRPLTANALKEASRQDGMAPGRLGHDRATRLIDLAEQGA